MKRFISNIRYNLKSKISTKQVIGYPKSGNTWLRMLIYNYFLINHKINFSNSFFDETNISLHNDRNIIFSHGTKDRRINKISDLNIDPFISKNRKTIFLVRDPRDVLVSLYYHEVYRYGQNFYTEDIWKKMFLLKNLKDTPSFSGFIRGDIRGINYIVDFMNYWYNKRKIFKEFKIISYEELHNTKLTLKKILSFFSIPIDENHLEQTVFESSFEKMRQKEINDDISQMDMSTPKNIKDNRTFKVRNGMVGSYKSDLFSNSDLIYVNNIIEKNLNKVFNY